MDIGQADKDYFCLVMWLFKANEMGLLVKYSSLLKCFDLLLIIESNKLKEAIVFCPAWPPPEPPVAQIQGQTNTRGRVVWPCTVASPTDKLAKQRKGLKASEKTLSGNWLTLDFRCQPGCRAPAQSACSSLPWTGGESLRDSPELPIQQQQHLTLKAALSCRTPSTDNTDHLLEQRGHKDSAWCRPSGALQLPFYGDFMIICVAFVMGVGHTQFCSQYCLHLPTFWTLHTAFGTYPKTSSCNPLTFLIPQMFYLCSTLLNHRILRDSNNVRGASHDN